MPGAGRLRYTLICGWFAAWMLAGSARAALLTTIATFKGANGVSPEAGLVADAAGNLYGTTNSGGANDEGVVFKVAARTHALTTVASFSGANGAYPLGGLAIDGQGNLYGTTANGGTRNIGTVFKVAAGTSAITTLATFTGVNGENPYASVTLDAAGNLYGTTVYGGAAGTGNAYKVAAGTSALSTLVEFTGSNGIWPVGGLTLDRFGNLYGTTNLGGAFGDGTVFKIAAGTNAFTTIASFNGTNGEDPSGALAFDAAGNLYGTAATGGPQGFGTAYKIAAGSNVITMLTPLGAPQSGLIIDAAGNLFGTTEGSDQIGAGNVFRIAAGSNKAITLAQFTGGNGANPIGGLFADADGNLFGTTYQGGSSNDGTVFEVSNAGFAVAPLPLAFPAGLVTGCLLMLRACRVRRGGVVRR